MLFDVLGMFSVCAAANLRLYDDDVVVGGYQHSVRGTLKSKPSFLGDDRHTIFGIDATRV